LKQITSKTFNEALITKLNEIFTDIYRKLKVMEKQTGLLKSIDLTGSSMYSHFVGFPMTGIVAVTPCQSWGMLPDGKLIIHKTPYFFWKVLQGWRCAGVPIGAFCDGDGNAVSVEAIGDGYFDLDIQGVEFICLYPITENYKIIYKEGV